MKHKEEIISRRKRIIKYFILSIFALLILWLSFVLYEMYRVRTDKRPIICFNEVRQVEDDDEYSITCSGILYKYREYYFIKEEVMSAREFTLFFKEFTRDIKDK